VLKISVVTVCYNSAGFIRDALCSVASQEYAHVEHIIVDGGSTDATLEIINHYREGISHLISEPDCGIYDAMNKGISLASGDVIGILNSDDRYAGTYVLDLIATAFEDPEIDACYADLVYVDRWVTDRITRHWKSGPYRAGLFEHGWMPPHPTFFVRRQCYQQYGGYRLDLGFSADYELMLRYLLCHKIRTVYIPHVLVQMRSGGASGSSLLRRLKVHLTDWKAWRVNGLMPYPWTVPCKPLRKLGQWAPKFTRLAPCIYF
jgi:glycosyltransferase